MKKAFFCDSPLGRLGLGEDDGALVRVLFGDRLEREGFAPGATPLLRRTADQLAEYFSGRRREFDLPLAPRGTEFQLAVWAALRTIPFGGTLSYQAVAARIGRPRACRAVGLANRQNPLAIIVPCHRVIGRDGRLTGYAGGLAAKKWLLDLEAGRKT